MGKIVVIGGYAQGKTAFAVEKFPEYQVVSPQECISMLQEGCLKDGASQAFLLDDFHLCMKQWLAEGKDYVQIVEQMLEYPAWIILANEIGSGIVPMEQSDRMWREETGRMLTKLASKADKVYRMYAGIPTLIKGES